MCLVLLAVDTHERYPLVIAANRDEFRARPTEAAHFWTDYPQVLAGRDLESGGTWLGVTRHGRIALVTNVRDRQEPPAEPISRGHLVRDFLVSTAPPADFATSVAGQASRYAGFNLICGSGTDLFHVSNRGSDPVRIARGVHGLSNGALDEPWPKVVSGRTRLAQSLSHEEVDTEALLDILADARPAEHGLPDTGVGTELEQFLSPIFIRGDRYGTLSSTVVMVDRGGTIHFVERSFSADGMPSTLRFTLNQ